MAIGNVLRHEYQQVDAETMWDIATGLVGEIGLIRQVRYMNPESPAERVYRGPGFHLRLRVRRTDPSHHL